MAAYYKYVICVVMMTLSVLVMSCAANVAGDYTNEFVVTIRGGEAEVQEVMSHLTKRSAVRVIDTMHMEALGGHLIHFAHKDLEIRSKRSLEDHSSISELASHPNIVSIEQQRILTREKRDYYSQEKIAEARRVVEEYLNALEKHKQDKLSKTDDSHADTEAAVPVAQKKEEEEQEYRTNIQHDKQLELDEPEYHEDKTMFKRYKPTKRGEGKLYESRDYSPEEERYINLNDEHWADQWYLNNLGQAGGPKGLDINVVPAWQQGFSGKDVAVCVLDDGIEHTHEDLSQNYWAEISGDFNDENDDDPMPNPDNLDDNSHGTRCAGEIAAQANNTVCGVGVAFNSRIGGIRILDGRVTDALEARALLYKNQKVDIYSASWGPRDDGKTMENPGKFCSGALEQGAKEGRGGKGSIFVWATGNGGYKGDDCAADGYVSSPYTLSIGSINNYAESTYFMEWCPSTLAVIYTGGFHSREDVFSYDERTHPILKIVTTDVRNKCTLNFQGTSSAAPLAAGVMALTLEANPNLTWRDVQHIVVSTAKIPNSIEQGWTINGAGFHINEKFGFGALDAAQMVQVAQTWNNVGPQHKCVIDAAINANISFNNKEPIRSTLETDGCQKTPVDTVNKIEHVQINIKMSAGRRGDIKLTLISPAGTSSEMLSPRRKDLSTDGIHFTFMTVRCWDEDPSGRWTLIVMDTSEPEMSLGGELISWSLTLLGTSHTTHTRDAERQTEQAYKPDKESLNHLMDLEADAAKNVNIKKGSESDVIEKFASETSGSSAEHQQHNQNTGSKGSNDQLASKVKDITKTMSKADIQKLIDTLKSETEQAKHARAEKQDRELRKRLEDFFES